MSKTHPQRIVSLLAVGITFFLLGLGISHFAAPKPTAAQKTPEGPPRAARPPAKIRVAVAKKGEITPQRNFHGKLTEVKKTSLSSEVAGVVIDLPVEVGSSVKGGETLIARIDDTWTALTLDSSQNDIELTDVKLAFEKRELEKLKPLLRSGAISESDFQTQLNKVDQLNTMHERAKIVFREATEKRKRTEIYAPFDGHIVAKATEIGSLLSPGTPIVQIVSSGEIDAVVNVVESVIDKMKSGDTVRVLVDPLGTELVGKVHAIVPYSSASGPRAFPVHIRMSDENGRLKVGMSVTARIPVGETQNGVIVPKDAVLDRPDGRTIWVAYSVQDKMIVEPVPVKILANAVDFFSVESETEDGKLLLKDGANIVIEGAERLAPKQTVVIKTVDPMFFENLPSGSGHSIINGSK